MSGIAVGVVGLAGSSSGISKTWNDLAPAAGATGLVVDDEPVIVGVGHGRNRVGAAPDRVRAGARC